MFDRIEELGSQPVGTGTDVIEAGERNREVEEPGHHEGILRCYHATLLMLLRSEDPEPTIQVKEMFDCLPDRFECSAAVWSVPETIWSFEGWRMKRYRISIPLDVDARKARICEFWFSREGEERPSATLAFTVDDSQLPRDVTDFVSREMTHVIRAGPPEEFQRVCLRIMPRPDELIGDRPGLGSGGAR